MTRFTRAASRVIGVLVLVGMLGVVGILLYVQTIDARLIRGSAADVATTTYAIVLGASVKQDGTPSDALSDRVKTGVELYKAGKVSKLLMSGDDGAFHVNEVETMRKLALEAGVTSTDVLVDGHGYRTYESCKRAAETHHIKDAVIVTQRFHLARALYLCDSFGMNVQGLAADLQPYKRILFFTIRDFGASLKAWVDVNVWAPESPVRPLP